MSVAFHSPTHAEVAAALDAIPDAAELISGRDPNTNCWADLILVAQHELPSDRVAAALKRLAEKWEAHVVLAWCPLSGKLWSEFQKAKNLEGEHAGKGKRLRRFRARTLFGTVGLIRPLWQETRREWMRQHGIKNDRDPGFLKQIIFYLEEADDDPTG